MPARTVMRWEIKKTRRQIKCEGVIMMFICSVWCISQQRLWLKKKKEGNIVLTRKKKRVWALRHVAHTESDGIKSESFPSPWITSVVPVEEFRIQPTGNVGVFPRARHTFPITDCRFHHPAIFIHSFIHSCFKRCLRRTNKHTIKQKCRTDGRTEVCFLVTDARRNLCSSELKGPNFE